MTDRAPIIQPTTADKAEAAKSNSRFHEDDSRVPRGGLMERKASNELTETATVGETEHMGQANPHFAPGSEYRNKLEKRLKWKLDARFSILFFIYSEPKPVFSDRTCD